MFYEEEDLQRLIETSIKAEIVRSGLRKKALAKKMSGAEASVIQTIWNDMNGTYVPTGTSLTAARILIERGWVGQVGKKFFVTKRGRLALLARGVISSKDVANHDFVLSRSHLYKVKK